MRQDLGDDFTGKQSYVLLSEESAVPGNPLKPTAAGLFGLRPYTGRGMRCYHPSLFAKSTICQELGLAPPVGLDSEKICFRAYKCKDNSKDVSPCFQNGITSLALCGSQVRQHAKVGDVVLVWDVKYGIASRVFRVSAKVTQEEYCTKPLQELLSRARAPMPSAERSLEPPPPKKPRPWLETPTRDKMTVMTTAALRTTVGAAKKAGLLPSTLRIHQAKPEGGRNYVLRPELENLIAAAASAYKKRREEFETRPSSSSGLGVVSSADPSQLEEILGLVWEQLHESSDDVGSGAGGEGGVAACPAVSEPTEMPAGGATATVDSVATTVSMTMTAAHATPPTPLPGTPLARAPPASPLGAPLHPLAVEPQPIDLTAPDGLELEHHFRGLADMYGRCAAHSILAMAHRSFRDLRPASILNEACARAGARRDLTLVYLAIKLEVDDANAVTNAARALACTLDSVQKAERAVCELLNGGEGIGSAGVFSFGAVL